MIMNLHSLLSFWCKVLFFILLPLSFALNPDGVSLLSFKYSILSDPLSVLDSWNYKDQTPCSWYGVTCDQIENRVTTLVLPNNQLLGSISEQLGNLQHLRYLDLSNNFLNGSLPTSIFNSSSQLQVLSLSNNVISGDVPELVGELKSLQILNLSDNALAGFVPKNLTTLKNLTFISLKSNYFSGEIPSGFHSVQVLDLSSNLLNGSLPNDFGGENLRYLNLSYNKISGTIPLKFAQNIVTNSSNIIDLSFNNLTGAIPESLALMKQRTLFLSGNNDLCGKPLKILCSIPSTLSNPPPNDTSSSPAIAAIPKTIDTTPEKNTTSSSSSHNESKSSNGLKPTTIVAIIVGDLVGVSILAMVIFFVYHHNTKTKSLQLQDVKKTPKPHFFPCLKNREFSSTSGSESEHESESTKIEANATTADLVTLDDDDDGETELDMETLMKASAYVMLGTRRRRESIVYKAVVEDGRVFAVRRIGGECGMMRRKDFENHVKSIARMRHPNLVKVRGFCWGQDEKLLVCDYVSNGSLASSFSHRGCSCSSSTSTLKLALEMRVKIAKGIARALAFIHDKKHVHANIKPTNILFNSLMQPIITDFGLHRLTPTASSSAQPDFSVASSCGTHQLLPYQAPESLQSHHLQPNPKWDVYSFGIVLLQLLSGRVFSDRELLDRWPEGGSMEEEKNRVLRMADVGIKGEVEGREEALLVCFKLGFRCASFKPQKRPTMKEALQILEKIPTATSSQ